ncbi:MULTISPECIES: FkbM family methyltransferase [Helicobacter]|uniref:FkbM family methyltransferase n=1 Tax=Helicobacter TaxID=209 RepID=UPI00262277B2|nr:FkbM family methyltransferase [Helicobacter sp. UBA3407]
MPIYHFEVGVFYHKHSLKEAFSKETLQRIRQKDIIDVGGFIGDSAIIFEREFTERNIYSFEPTSKNYALMQETLRLNDSKRIIPIHQGLGIKSENLKIRFFGSASHIDLRGQSEDLESISITTLDEFVRENKLEVGFIKVDMMALSKSF